MKYGHIERGGRAGVHTNVNGQAFPNKFRFLRISDSRRLKAVGKNNRLDSLFTSPLPFQDPIFWKMCVSKGIKRRRKENVMQTQSQVLESGCISNYIKSGKKKFTKSTTFVTDQGLTESTPQQLMAENVTGTPLPLVSWLSVLLSQLQT